MITAARYEVTIDESRVITLRRKMHILASSPEGAREQGGAQAAFDWEKIGERHGVTLGPPLSPDAMHVAQLRELADRVARLNPDTANIDPGMLASLVALAREAL